jgi:formylglycine-generating enzyme required for sulfatase activity
MNMKKSIVAAAVAAMAVQIFSAVPEVTSVTMSQAADRSVTITYELDNAPAVVTLDVQTNCTVDGEVKWASIGGQAVCNAQGAVWRKVTADDADDQGRYKITWHPDLSWPDHKIPAGGARAVVSAWALDNTPDYMAVDIASAAKSGSQRYYPSADFVPGGVLGNPDYRTTTILMRKIMAKDVTWTMGSTALETMRNKNDSEKTHKVTLTNNYYIGVFEITQSQWGLIKADNLTPSRYNNPAYRAMRPVEQVSYNEIRNSANKNANTAYDWPAEPNPASFLGLLYAKTGIRFDLPSEAQWEYACRAGNGDTKWGDGSGIQNKELDENLYRMARTRSNGGRMISNNRWVDCPVDCDLLQGTAHVGTYKQNDWGLYDMHGNVWEWCLDWYEDNIATAKDSSGGDYNGRLNIDPSNSQAFLSGKSAANRVIRGGSHYLEADAARSANRNSQGSSGTSFVIGFRVVCTAGLK